METTNALLVITAIVNKENMAELPTYLGSVMEIFGKNGGKPVGRYKTTNLLVGEDSPEMMAIIEFSDAQTIQNLVQSDEFNALADMRARVFNKLNMMVSTTM